MAEDYTLQGADYYDYTDTEPTESGSEFDCAGEVAWDTSVAMFEYCVGKPCEEGRMIPLNREQNEIEKSGMYQALVCQDGTWALDWFDSGTGSGSDSETGSIYNCYEGMVIANDMYGTMEPWSHECIGQPCDEGAERKIPSDQDRGSTYWQELICIGGSWDYINNGESGWDDSGWTENSPNDADGLEDFSTDEICYELCARKTLGDNKVDGLPDGFPDLEDLLPTDPGAALQACLESCLGPLSFNDADGGSATDENSETGSSLDIITAVDTTTTQWPFASTCCTTTEEFVTTLTPIATTTEDFATTTVSPSACDEERTHECPNNSFCVPADNFVTFTCQCEAGYFMSGNMCHKKAPEAETCPEDFKKDLFKMKLDGLTNPKYYLNKGSVMIQVESQVISRFRRGLNRLDFVT